MTSSRVWSHSNTFSPKFTKGVVWRRMGRNWKDRDRGNGKSTVVEEYVTFFWCQFICHFSTALFTRLLFLLCFWFFFFVCTVSLVISLWFLLVWSVIILCLLVEYLLHRYCVLIIYFFEIIIKEKYFIYLFFMKKASKIKV